MPIGLTDALRETVEEFDWSLEDETMGLDCLVVCPDGECVMEQDAPHCHCGYANPLVQLGYM